MWPDPRYPLGALASLRNIDPLQALTGIRSPEEIERTLAGGKRIALGDTETPETTAPAPNFLGLTPLPQTVTTSGGTSSSTTSGIRVPKSASVALQQSAELAEQGARETARANVLEAQAQRQAYGDIAAQRQRELGQLTAKRKQLEAERDKLDATYRAEVAAAREAEPNPDRWWSSRNAAGKVMTILASLAGARAQMLGGGPNVGLQYIEGEIVRDIAAQEKSLARKAAGRQETRSMLADLTARLGDVDAAKANLRVMLAENLAERVELARLNVAEPRIQGQLAASLSAIRQVQADADLKLAELTSARTVTQTESPRTQTTTPQMYEMDVGGGKKIKVSAEQIDAQSKMMQAQAKAGAEAPVVAGSRKEQADAAESYSLKALEMARLLKQSTPGTDVKSGLLGAADWAWGTGKSKEAVQVESLVNSMAAQEMRTQNLPPSGELLQQKKKEYLDGLALSTTNADVGSQLMGKLDQQLAILEGLRGTAQSLGDKAELKLVQDKIQTVKQVKGRIGSMLLSAD